ncbi:hypothetical protein DB346_18825 [Verrucomicrobia bacterium LW23]|nr:hypothetical protein DB346_18825 [Verrucomicrobia bacterium LW23]
MTSILSPARISPRFRSSLTPLRALFAFGALMSSIGCLAPGGLCTGCCAGETLQPQQGSKSAKDLKTIVDDQAIYVETAQRGVRLSGYVEASYTNQFASKGEASESTESALRNDVDHNDFNINAFKLVLEKDLSDRKDEWSAGFRTDLWFGEDAVRFGGADPATSPGESLFLHQAFVSMRVPVGNGLIVKFGKIAGLLGYEAEERPENMNYSFGLMSTNYYNGASTGVMLTYPFTEHLEATVGMVSSWEGSDTAFFGLGIQEFGNAFTGQITYTVPGGNAWLSGTFFVAPDGSVDQASPAFLDNLPLAVGEISGEWRPKCVPNEALILAFDLMAGFAGSGTDAVFGAPTQDNSNWWGLGLYSKYRFTPVFSLAGRAEYLHNDDSGKIVGNSIPGNNAASPLGSSTDLWSGTITAGFDLWENVLTRVEYRYDRGSDDTINGLDQHQVSVDVVYSF